MKKRTQEARTERVRRRPRSKAPRIARTQVGLGVFAQQRYIYEELIGEINGEVIDDAEYSSDYCMDMGDARCLEPAAPFRYMNHSCDPNCRFDWYDVLAEGDANQRRRVFVFAIDEIDIGEELTIDYAWPAEMAIACRCGSPHCRGWIVAEEQRSSIGEGGVQARVDLRPRRSSYAEIAEQPTSHDHNPD